MSDAAQLILAKLGFYGAVLILVYLVYYELTSSRNKKEAAQRELGENENENRVNSLTPDELIELINDGKEPGGTEGGSGGKKST